MFRFWRRLKPWVRWTIGVLTVLLLLGASALGYLYYQIKSIELVDIQHRIEAKASGEPMANEPQEVPAIIGNTLEKASSLASKPVKAQDAMDVAAILVNSGLSMREVYYLIGQSTDKLSNPEKQKIRDLLLAKLTDEEIKALRAITAEYGKGLIILDPNYPIELVGVYDETERAKIMKELESQKQNKSLAAAQTQSSGQSSSPSSIPIKTPSATASSPVNTPTKSAVNQGVQIQTKYQAKLEGIQASCSARVETLSKELSTKLKASSADSSKTLQELQATFLPQVIQAEQQCDEAFNQVMGEAAKEFGDAGLDPKELDGWRKTYNDFKQQAKAKAIHDLSTAAAPK